MRKGTAMEGFIREDGTIRPIEHYDDTELRDNISNLESRVKYIEDHGAHEDDPSKADKVEGATAGNLASLDEDGNLQDSGKKVSDFIEKPDTAREDRIAVFGPNKTLVEGAWSMDGVNTAIKNLVKYGVLYSHDSSYSNIPYITVIESDRGYVIDTEASGETFSHMSGVQEGIFIPVKVKVVRGENAYDYHIGYYYTDGTNKNIHLEGLVFEYDTTNNVWLPAKDCIVGDQVPHWKKIGSTTGWYDQSASALLISAELASMIYIGMPIRLYGKASAIGRNYKARVTYIGNGPYYVQVSVSLADAGSEGVFDIYVLSNLDSFLDFDTTPTQYSRKLMTSGAIYTALHALEERVAALEALHAEETEPSAES